jgi:methionine synthase I (cobalamin-dependent)
LSAKLCAINQTGVRLAREAAGASCYVAGAVGPMGAPARAEEARIIFREQIEVCSKQVWIC